MSFGRLISASKLPASETNDRRLVLEESSSMSPFRGSTIGVIIGLRRAIGAPSVLPVSGRAEELPAHGRKHGDAALHPASMAARERGGKRHHQGLTARREPAASPAATLTPTQHSMPRRPLGDLRFARRAGPFAA